MIRDMSGWPPVLREALEPGVAPTLDQLAEEARQVFWREVSKEQSPNHFVVQDLSDAAIEVCERQAEETIFQAIHELWGLNEYAMPYPASFDTVFGSIISGAFVPCDMIIDLLYGAIITRARLDEAVEKEEIERQAMMQLTRRPTDPVVDRLASELTGGVGDIVPYMTFDELIATMRAR